MTSYEEILDLTKQLSAAERVSLADAMLAEELGFGMWRARVEMADVTAYVEQLRASRMHTPEGRRKTPAEFLREIEADDE